MIDDLIGVICSSSKSLAWVSVQQTANDVFKFVAHEYVMSDGVREHNFSRPDQNTESVVRFVHERRSAGGHLVQQDAQGPPVNAKAVTFHVENLGGQVLSCAAEGVGLVLSVVEELGEAEVSQRHISILVHKHVLRLQVPMHDVVLVQVAHSENNLRANKLHCFLFKPLISVDVVVDVSAGEEVQEKVNTEFVLEHKVHGVDEGVLRLEKDIFFVFNVFHLLLLNQDVLVDSFHRVELLHLLIVNEEHFAERPFVDNPLDLEIGQSDFLATDARPSNQTQRIALIHNFGLFVQLLWLVVLIKLRLVNDYEIFEQFIVCIGPPFSLFLGHRETKMLGAVDEVVSRWHARDLASHVLFCRQVVFQCG